MDGQYRVFFRNLRFEVTKTELARVCWEAGVQALHLNIVRKGNYGKQRMCSAFVEVGSSGDVTRLCQRLNGYHNFAVAEVPLLVEAAEPRRGGKGPPAGWKGAAPKAPAAPAPAPAAPAPAAPKQAPAAPKQAPAAPKAEAAAPKAAAAASASVPSPTSRAVSGEEDEESAGSSSSDAAGSDTEPPSPGPGIVVARYAKRRKLQYTPTEPGDVEPGVKSDLSSSCS